MPYPAHPTTEAANLAREFVTAKTRFDANKNILKSGALKKAMENAGLALANQVETDIAAIRHNGVEHFLKVDTTLTNCINALKRAEEAHERWTHTQQDHDAEIATAAAVYIAAQAQEIADDGLAFGASWMEYRTFNCAEAPKYMAKFKEIRGKFIEDGKSPMAKIIRVNSLSHEALALKNLHLSARHANDRVILEKQGAAAELYRSLHEMFHVGFEGLKSIQFAAGNCEAIRDTAQNPRLKKEGDLKHSEGVFMQLGTFRKIYVQTSASMQKTYQTGVRQFSEEDARDPDIKTEIGKCRVLVDDARQKLQFIENGYKDATKNMERIRAILKK